MLQVRLIGFEAPDGEPVTWYRDNAVVPAIRRVVDLSSAFIKLYGGHTLGDFTLESWAVYVCAEGGCPHSGYIVHAAGLRDPVDWVFIGERRYLE